MDYTNIPNITEIINALIHYGSILMLIMSILVVAVNAIVEVAKRLMPKIPTDLVVFIVSIAVTVLALLVAAAVMEITIMWYYAVGAVVLGIFVAYAAMFGFDKFSELLSRLKAQTGV